MRLLVHIIMIAALLTAQAPLLSGAEARCAEDGMAIAGDHSDMAMDETPAGDAWDAHGLSCNLADGCTSPAHCVPVLVSYAPTFVFQVPATHATRVSSAWPQPDLPAEIEPPRS